LGPCESGASKQNVAERVVDTSVSYRERPAPRINIRLIIELICEDCEPMIQGVSENISETGVLVRTSGIARQGTTVHLEFKEFGVHADLVWRKDTRDGILLGIRFLSIGWGDPKALTHVFEFMEKHG
jgi:hypothetical protein